MKIISVACLNLNSLRGKHPHRLDFEAAPLDGCGLFAITGPTGAGKTTLLDAITLALYNETPRKNKGETLLSPGAGEAWAEVVYEVPAGRFRSKWSIWRAGKKMGGAVQTAHMEVWAVAGEKMVAEKSTPSIRKNEELTGMKAGQFTRSVLLAQGSFDKFLKADEKDKAELLERITGEEVYNNLSERADTRRKTEEKREAELEKQLGAVRLLSATEVTEKTTALTELTAQAEAAREAAGELGRQHNWRKALDELAVEQAAAAAALEKAQAALAAEQTSLDALAAHQQAEPFEQRWLDAGRARKEAAAATEKSQEFDRQLTLATDIYDELLEAISDAEKGTEPVWAQARQALADRKPALDEALARLPLLETLTTTAKRDQQTATAKRTEYTAAVRKFRDFRAGTRTARQEATALRQWLSDRAADQHLTAALGEVKDLLNERATAANEFRRLDKEAGEQQTAFLSANQTKRNEQQNLANERDALAGLDEEVGLLHGELAGLSQTATASLRTAQNELRRAQDDELALRERLLGKTLLRDHAQHLRPGTECPLCGAREHPAVAAGIDVSAPAILALEAQLTDQQTRVQTQQQAVDINQDVLRTLSSLNLRVLAAPSEATAQLGGTAALRHARAVAESLRGEPVSRIEHERNSRAFARAADQARDQAQSAVTKWREARAGREQARQRGACLTTQLEELATRHRATFDRRNPTALSQELIARQETHQRRAGELAQIGLALAGADAQAIALRATYLRLHQEATQIQQQAAQAAQAAQQCATQIAAAHPGSDSPRTALAALETAEQATRTAHEQALNKVKTAEADCQTLRRQRDEKTQEADQRQATEATLLAELRTELPAAGLPADPGQLPAWLLPLPERQRLRELERRLAWTADTAHKRAEDLTQEQERLRAQALTAEPLAALALAWQEASNQHQALRDAHTLLAGELRTDAKHRSTHAGLAARLEQQKAETRRWKALNDLLGSRDNKKFSRFAQGLTLAQLAEHANVRLREFSDRYQLRRRDDHTLGLLVDDLYDERTRDVDTLSGGETFLVSLALALGLADLMSADARLDSLFIDEGFGTLDAETLQVALSALNKLKNQGKTVGIVTHVPLDILSSHIDTYVLVERVGQGSSRLRVLPEVG